MSPQRHATVTTLSQPGGHHTLMAAVLDYFNTLEGNLCLRVNRLARAAGVRTFFALISKLGDGWIWAAAGIVLVVLHGNAAMQPIAVMAATAIAGIAIYKALKNRLVRERPYINHLGIDCGAAPLDRYSFPSGHTLHAVSFTVMLNAAEPALSVLTLPLALLIAASRVILGLHYPSDVIVGAAIGGVLGSAAMPLLQVG